MLILLFGAALAFNTVLAIFLARDIPLLLRICRWSTTLYVLGLALVTSELSSEGLVIVKDDNLEWDLRVLWVIWIGLCIAAVLDWRFLLPATLLPLWLLNCQQVATLLGYGIVRLGLSDVVYNPFSWLRGGRFLLAEGLRAFGYVHEAFVPQTIVALLNSTTHALF